jgi:hypothetical protein
MYATHPHRLPSSFIYAWIASAVLVEAVERREKGLQASLWLERGYKDVSSTSGAPRQNLTGESIEVWKVVSP